MKKIVIIGAGFTGLSAGLKLLGGNLVIIESENKVGGLAGGFKTEGQNLECFYHHWFTSDDNIMRLVRELSLEKNLEYLESKTGLYYNQNFFKLSSPIDLLKFKALSFISRIRLGILVLYARSIKNYRELENITAKDWLILVGGEQVYRIVWEPLLKGKFGPYAEKISAVWFWKKINLRGGSRAKNGKEQLVYFKGGFMRLTEAMAEKIQKGSAEIKLNCKVNKIVIKDNKVLGVECNDGFIDCDIVLDTTALPLFADKIEGQVSNEYFKSLREINYIGNVCLILELDRSLSSYYWLNVNDPSFPFVGIIEHTNLVNKSMYGNNHIVYLSKYIPTSDYLYTMSDKEFFNYSIPYIKKMFPDFEESWVQNYNLWKSPFSQPVVENNYSKKIPNMRTPVKGLYLSTMAQIYPEDRGTNYAVEYGEKVAQIIIDDTNNNFI